MTSAELIDSYVRDVARRLPRSMRNDVAHELRSLLADDLAETARAAGREPDEDMAMQMLARFGHPSSIAARYHTPAPVIEPADTHHFIIWAFAGAIAVSVLRVLDTADAADASGALLRWLGALAIVFALIGLWRRHSPLASTHWKPKRDSNRPSRPTALALGVLALLPVVLYAAPRLFVNTVFPASVASDGLALDASFAWSPLRIATMVALALHAIAWLAVAAEGRWRTWTSWLRIAALLSSGLLLAVHAAVAGQDSLFSSAESNEVAAPIFALVGALTVLSAFYEVHREWSRVSPAPRILPA